MSEQKLTLDQAIQNIAAVLAAYKGSLGEHAALQESLKLIADKCKEAKAEVE